MAKICRRWRSTKQEKVIDEWSRKGASDIDGQAREGGGRAFWAKKKANHW